MKGAECTCPECGAVFETATPKKERSAPHLRRFHALIRAAYFQWPEQHPEMPRPRSESRFRYWLEMKAGFFDVVKMVRVESMDADKLYHLLCAMLKHSDDEKLFLDIDGNLITEMKTRSISYGAMGHNEFAALAQAVEEIIEAELGVSADKLLRETDKAA